jgi:hypothetical protein
VAGTQAALVEFLAPPLIGEININQGVNQRVGCEWKTRKLRLKLWLLVLRISTPHSGIGQHLILAHLSNGEECH